MKKILAATIAAAALLGVTPVVPAIWRRSRPSYEQSQRRRHQTKGGPGRAGHNGRIRHTKLHTGSIHRGSGHRNLRKLLGTRG